MEVPMLEEGEAKIAYELLNAGFKNRLGSNFRERFSALIAYYKEVTGEEYTNPNAIMHHIVDAYGHPCEKCGNP